MNYCCFLSLNFADKAINANVLHCLQIRMGFPNSKESDCLSYNPTALSEIIVQNCYFFALHHNPFELLDVSHLSYCVTLLYDEIKSEYTKNI